MLQGGRMKKVETVMVPVPLPTEVPPPPRLDHIPLDILHSATVEMLIQQNDDLSSRLKVNLQRNSVLEQKIIENEKEILELNRKRENVLAQNEIIKEKEKIWSEQKQIQEKQMQSIEQESELLELRYNELYTTSQQKEKNQQKALAEKQAQIHILQEKLDILQRVRIRAKERLRSMLLDMAHGFSKNQKYITRTESSQRLLKKNFEELRNEINEKESFFKDQLNSLKEASKKSLMSMDERITELKTQNSTLSQNKAELEAEIEELTLKLHQEKKNRIKLNEAQQALAELKNERIRNKRELENFMEKSEIARMGQRTDNEKLKEEIKQLKLEKETSSKDLSVCEAKILELTRDNREISEQLESIQKLWMQAQTKLEKEELRAKTLEKINRELSQQDKSDKTERAIEKAQKTSENQELRTKIKDVFASQYRTIDKVRDIEL